MSRVGCHEVPPPSSFLLEGSVGGGAAGALASTGVGVQLFPPFRGKCSLTLTRWCLPALQGVIVSHALEGGTTPPETAPARALHAYLPLGVELFVKSIAVTALGLEVLVLCLGSHALTPRTVRSLVDESALAVTSLSPSAHVRSRRGLLTATRTSECVRALGVTTPLAVSTITLAIDWPSRGPA